MKDTRIPAIEMCIEEITAKEKAMCKYTGNTVCHLIGVEANGYERWIYGECEPMAIFEAHQYWHRFHKPATPAQTRKYYRGLIHG